MAGELEAGLEGLGLPPEEGLLDVEAGAPAAGIELEGAPSEEEIDGEMLAEEEIDNGSEQPGNITLNTTEVPELEGYNIGDPVEMIVTDKLEDGTISLRVSAGEAEIPPAELPGGLPPEISGELLGDQ